MRSCGNCAYFRRKAQWFKTWHGWCDYGMNHSLPVWVRESPIMLEKNGDKCAVYKKGKEPKESEFVCC